MNETKINMFDRFLYVQSRSPFRTPDWRWTIAKSRFAQGMTVYRGTDTVFGHLFDYLRCSAGNGEVSASRHFPALAAAHRIYNIAGVVRDELEARLLAGEPSTTINAKMNINVAAIEAFEQAFFNVSESLNAVDWLFSSVLKIIPGQPVTEAQTWKYLALAGGPALLDLMVDDYLVRPEVTTSSNRSELAAKGRFIVREWATDWGSAEEAKSLLKEWDRLFPGIQRDPLMNMHRQIIELAGSARRKSPVEPIGRLKPVSRRRRTPRKASHGRPKSKGENRRVELVA